MRDVIALLLMAALLMAAQAAPQFAVPSVPQLAQPDPRTAA